MFKTLYPINTPVIFNGKFANVTGYDNGAEMIIIEFCDWRDGKFLAVNSFDLYIDEDEIASADLFENNFLTYRK